MMTDKTTPTSAENERDEHEHAQLTADIVLFGDGRTGRGVHPKDLHVLLIRRGHAPFAGMWALPGGRVDAGEHTAPAAHRELGEETGLRVPALRPFAVYADPDRDPRGRVVTFAYVARIIGTPEAKPGDDATDARWVLVNDIYTGKEPVAFDHQKIITDATGLVIGPDGEAAAMVADYIR